MKCKLINGALIKKCIIFSDSTISPHKTHNDDDDDDNNSAVDKQKTGDMEKIIKKFSKDNEKSKSQRHIISLVDSSGDEDVLTEKSMKKTQPTQNSVITPKPIVKNSKKTPRRLKAMVDSSDSEMETTESLDNSNYI